MFADDIARDSDAMVAPTPDMTGVFSIDEYRLQYAEETGAAAQLNKGKGKGKEGSILQTNASTSSSQHPDGAASNAPYQTPVALSTVRTSAKTVRRRYGCYRPIAQG